MNMKKKMETWEGWFKKKVMTQSHQYLKVAGLEEIKYNASSKVSVS